MSTPPSGNRSEGSRDGSGPAAPAEGRIRKSLRKRLRPVRQRFAYALSRRRGTRAVARLERTRVPDWRDIPVIVNNRNRLTYMTALLDRLESIGCRRIVVLDNDSDYPPLLEWYATTRHEVVRLGANLGHRALWISGIADQLAGSWFVYTDPDVVPEASCPDDFLALFLETLREHPELDKVGFGLRIDDVPECYAQRDDVVRWERRFWTERHSERFFHAPIDTTFAVYRPCTIHGPLSRCLRSDAPYLARHLPWYEDTANLTEEQAYYYDHVAPAATWWSPRSAPSKSLLLESPPVEEGSR